MSFGDFTTPTVLYIPRAGACGSPRRTADTCPLRRRPRVRYAGSMTVNPAPQPRPAPSPAATNFEKPWPPCSFLTGSRPWPAGEHHKVAKVAKSRWSFTRSIGNKVARILAGWPPCSEAAPRGGHSRIRARWGTLTDCGAARAHSTCNSAEVDGDSPHHRRHGFHRPAHGQGVRRRGRRRRHHVLPDLARALLHQGRVRQARHRREGRRLGAGRH